MGHNFIEVPVTNEMALTGIRPQTGRGFDLISSHKIRKSNFPEKFAKKPCRKPKVK